MPFLLAAALALAPTIHDKTLVAWVAPANLTERGGSVLTIEKPGGVFDGIVFGEIQPRVWMAGSDSFRRTLLDQSRVPTEGQAQGPIQVAITYHGIEVSVYRNGQVLEHHTTTNPESFGAGAKVLLGLRHTDAAPQNRFFTGIIQDARIYDKALSLEELDSLRFQQEGGPTPYAWWNFKDGSVTDRMHHFPVSTLHGDARVAKGELELPTEGSYLEATEEQSTALTPGTPAFFSAVRNFQESLVQDRFRPGYHFVIPEGTAMPFDPDGAIYWKGQYHLFYIYQDARGHNWGHVSSTDFFHWRQHPTGLTDGMFSGNCFVDKNGRPTMCYHQVGQGDSMAVSLDDDLDNWQKLKSSPITPREPSPKPEYRSWDPYCWIENGTYYAIMGGNRPAVIKSTSIDGPWHYVGDLMANAAPGIGIDEDVSCADFFKLGNRMMLLCISHRLGCRYYLGEWKNEQFHPDFQERMSWVDNSFFAPRSLIDDKGRRIMWSWVFDKPGFQVLGANGWSGTMSLPRVLTLDSRGRLNMNPPSEIESLRYGGVTQTNISVPDGEIDVPAASGTSEEIYVELKSSATRYGVKVCSPPDGAEQTSIYYDAKTGKLCIDTTRSSLDSDPKSVEAGPLKLDPGETLKLRIFVDKSIVEVFANGRQAVTRRIYPSRRDSLGVSLFAVGGTATAVKLQAWKMMPSNPF